MTEDQTWNDFAWAELRSALAGALGSLAAGQYLVISTRAGNRFVQFSAFDDGALQAEAASNRVLRPNERLDPPALDRLDGLGWNRPTCDLGEPDDPSGSVNHFFRYDAPVPWSTVASQAVRTLVEVFRVQHPNELQYYAFTDCGVPILLPGLGLGLDVDGAPENPLRDRNLDGAALAERVHEVLDATFGDVTEWNEDGFLHVDGDGVTVSVRVHGDPPVVSVFAPLVSGIDATDADALRELAQQNLGARFVRFVANDDVVIGEYDLFGRPFVPDHLVYAVRLLGDLAESIDEEFAARVGGQVFFGATGDSRGKGGGRIGEAG